MINAESALAEAQSNFEIGKDNYLATFQKSYDDAVSAASIPYEQAFEAYNNERAALQAAIVTKEGQLDELIDQQQQEITQLEGIYRQEY